MKNLQLATALHEAINKKYPGVSRGVIQKGSRQEMESIIKTYQDKQY